MVAPCERGPDRGGLQLGDLVEAIDHGSDELGEASDRKIRLRLGTAHTQRAHAGGGLAGDLQRRRLPDARLAPQDKRAAPPRPRAFKQVIDPCAFPLATDESHRPIVGGGPRRTAARGVRRPR